MKTPQSDTMDLEMDHSKSYSESARLATFKNWPYNDKKKCNAKAMARAGFYCVAQGSDSAKCFLCDKELDGWDPTDDPWAEHKSHAPYCAFVQMGKEENDLTIIEFLSIISQFMKNEVKLKAQILDEELDKIRAHIINSYTRAKGKK